MFQGKAIPLWERVNRWNNLDFSDFDGWKNIIPDGMNCYNGCKKLENYDSIPIYWKLTDM